MSLHWELSMVDHSVKNDEFNDAVHYFQPMSDLHSHTSSSVLPQLPNYHQDIYRDVHKTKPAACKTRNASGAALITHLLIVIKDCFDI